MGHWEGQGARRTVTTCFTQAKLYSARDPALSYQLRQDSMIIYYSDFNAAA